MCLEALLHMSERWKLAKNCHAVLSDLAEAIQGTEDTAKRPAFDISDSTLDSVHSGRDSVSSAMNYQSDSRKRARLDTESSQRNDGSGQLSSQFPTDIVTTSMDEPLGNGFGPDNTTGPTIEDDLQYFGDPGRLSNWESGMPDLLAGITWESLLGGINEDDPTLDNAYF